MDDTLAEIDLDEWNNAFVGKATRQRAVHYVHTVTQNKTHPVLKIAL